MKTHKAKTKNQIRNNKQIIKCQTCLEVESIFCLKFEFLVF